MGYSSPGASRNVAPVANLRCRSPLVSQKNLYSPIKLSWIIRFLSLISTLNGVGANDCEVDEELKKPLKYPKQVFFIISNEFCERFCFYGNRTILAIYLQSKLNYSEDDSTIIYHSFVMFCYFFPFIGAIIADCFWGKFSQSEECRQLRGDLDSKCAKGCFTFFSVAPSRVISPLGWGNVCGRFALITRTILYLSILYAIGNITLSTASSMELPIDPTTLSLLGLFLIAIGTGGIKPCVSSFGGDQFVLPQQERQLASFFSVFYFSINAGSTISTYLTPELRVIPCLGSDSCYPLAFGIPAALMVTSLVFFVCGKPLYTMKNPEGNIMVDASKCIGRGLWRKITSKEKKDHWLDHAADKYSPQLVEDTKILIELIYLFSPTILFWALYDQQGSRWTFQAVHMNGKIWNYTIKPDQMQAVNPILIMIFIPVFELIIYPILAKLRLVRTSLEKLFWGGIIAAVAFAISAYVEHKVQDSYAVLPQEGEAQLQIYNNYNCSLHITAAGSGNSYSWTIDSMGLLEEKSIPVRGQASLTYSAAFDGTGCPSLLPVTDGKLSIFEAEAVSFITAESQNMLDIIRLDETFDDLEKSDNTEPKVRIVYSTISDISFSLYNKKQTSKVDGTLNANAHVTETYIVEPTGDYSLQVNNKVTITDLPLDVGGVYTILLGQKTDTAALFTLTPPNSVHILWQLPQIIVISAAEIMFSITGLEFSYSKAPQSMKSVISSLWLLTDSFGNLIIIVVSEFTKSVPQEYMLLAFAVMMVVVMLVFILLARRYTSAMKRIDNIK